MIKPRVGTVTNQILSAVPFSERIKQKEGLNVLTDSISFKKTSGSNLTSKGNVLTRKKALIPDYKLNTSINHLNRDKITQSSIKGKDDHKYNQSNRKPSKEIA